MTKPDVRGVSTWLVSPSIQMLNVIAMAARGLRTKPKTLENQDFSLVFRKQVSIQERVSEITCEKKPLRE